MPGRPPAPLVDAIIKLSSPATQEFWAIPVRYEDDHLLALDKPAGLLLFPDRAEPARPSLMPLLRRDLERGAPWVRHRQLVYLANAHRLEVETTGVLLLAKELIICFRDIGGIQQHILHAFIPFGEDHKGV